MKALLAGVVLSLIVAQTPRQVETGSIQGTVIREGTKEPLAGVRITVALGTLRPISSAGRAQFSFVPPPSSAVTSTTDGAGQFSFTNLAPGEYTVQAHHEGFFGFVMGDLSLESAQTNVRLEPQQLRTQVALSLIPGAVVGGRVVSAAGAPLANITVSAYQVRYFEGKPVLTTGHSRVTDDQGNYRLFWLPPGEYYVGAKPASTPATASGSANLVTTYFPKMPEARLAQLLKISAGEDRGGVEIAMQNLSNVSIRGRIIRPDATTDGNYTFTVVPRDENALRENAEQNFPNVAPDRSNGQFELRGILPGSYALYVREGASGGYASLDLTEEGLRDVAVVVRPGVEVRGRVIMDGVAVPPVSGTAPSARPPTSTLALQAIDSAARSFRARIDASGSLVFSGVMPGTYRLQGTGPFSVITGLPSNAYISDIRQGASVFDSGIVIDGSAPVPEVQVILRTDGATVEGTVVDAQQKPIGRAFVALVPEISYRSNSLRYKTGSADASGHFRLTDVHPGNYKVFAWTMFEELPSFDAYRNSGFIARVEDHGVRVNIGAGAQASVQVRVVSK